VVFERLITCGSVSDCIDFVESLSSLLKLRQLEFIRTRLFCSRAFGERQATPQRTCRESIAIHPSPDVRRLILGWVTAYGPFIEDDRYVEADDYFEFEGHDVTDQGLGEASRRVGNGEAAGTYSFTGSNLNFERDPLAVQHGLKEAPIKVVDVGNTWEVEALRVSALEAIGLPSTWQQMVELCRAKYDRLVLPDDILTILNMSPFHPNVSQRVVELLRVLQEYMEHRLSNGAAGPRALEIYQQYFTGERARFSDESESNKISFESEMTFIDPDGKRIFCPWHGKIQTPQFRIHFEWPVPAQQHRLKVLYIGPKITKR
jgi:hypothetical protein